jgi:DNA repair protein RadA/Sms
MAKQNCARCKHAFDEHKAQCPACKHWNIASSAGKTDGTVLLKDVTRKKVERIMLPLESLNRIWGGGMAVGTTTLLGGKAGAGKSTLALQLADHIAISSSRETLYLAAEENEEQLNDRASRLAIQRIDLVRIIPMGSDADPVACVERYKPVAMIIDSLPGYVSSPEEAVDFCKALKNIAVQYRMPIVIIDHITKEDDFAGLEKLQHEVDTTMLLYPIGTPGEADAELRELTVQKNRFGPANQNAYLLMTEGGLVEFDPESIHDE